MRIPRIPVIALLMPWIAQYAALAGNEGPHGMPPRPISTLAELRDEGAVVPNPVRTLIQIKDNGQIWIKKENTTTLIGALSPKATHALIAKAETAHPSELIDENEGEPYCLGSGRVSYVVFQQGKEVEIGAELGCHMLRAPEGEGVAIIQTLKAAKALAGIPRAAEGFDDASPGAPKQLAQILMEGGNRPPSAPRSWGTRILRSGDVARFTDKAEETWLTISAERLAALSSLIERIPALPLPETDPNRRGCMDMPSTRYEALRSDGTTVELAQVARCIPSSSEDPSARFVVRLLDLLNRTRN